MSKMFATYAGSSALKKDRPPVLCNKRRMTRDERIFKSPIVQEVCQITTVIHIKFGNNSNKDKKNNVVSMKERSHERRGNVSRRA